MARSVFGLLDEAATHFPNRTALKYKEKDVWKELNWREVRDRACAVASQLIERGIQSGDRVVILSQTRFEWAIADLGILAAGGCTVPIYHSNIASDVAYIAQDCDARLAIVENSLQAAKLPHLQQIRIDDLNPTITQEKEIRKRVAATKESDWATIIYTSGTTGNPKGACLTHSNLLYEAEAIEEIELLSSSDVQLIFLPLAHVFARVMEIAWLKTAHVLCFAESVEAVVSNMKEIQPTFMAAVPRVYEKVYARVLVKARSGRYLKRQIANWAFEKQKKPQGLAWLLARYLVFSKIEQGFQEMFGKRLRFFISGGAPLNPEIGAFFKDAGVQILEGWGLTETAAATCVNRPQQNRMGTVGQPLPRTELRIAEDGEVEVRGPGVFQQYWNLPQQTAEAFKDGWFKTGDMGVIDPEGFLRITGRKKDIIITAGGKKIAPQKLENALKAATSLISQVLVFGDQKPYLIGLLTLDAQVVEGFAKRKGFSGNFEELIGHPEVLRRIEQAIKRVNQGLSSFEQIKKFQILPQDFLVGEELTPTLKVKRGYCVQKFRTHIERLYR
ncbi:MAG: long-chain fatty acid--CoA ligase [Myxococcaceae bacterium]|nr:long-chain fatty acid--CoA ligase [Myxococcaceae bacterium]MBH2005915.1 long-chain fatty acid--CoA ligase [Myxococcaceae bacterium]